MWTRMVFGSRRTDARRVGGVVWAAVLLGIAAGAAAEPVGGYQGVPLPRGMILEQFGTPPGSADQSGEDTSQASQKTPVPDRAGESPAANVAELPRRVSEDQVVLRRSSPARSNRAVDAHQLVASRDAAAASWSFQDVIPLLTVLAVIGLAVWAVKRFMPARRMLTGGGVLEVVARLPLSGRQSLVLVKMGRQLVLLGVSAERIAPLTVVDDPDEAAVLVGEAASRRPDSMTRAFVEDFRQEAGPYEEPGRETRDAAAVAGGQVRGLLDKIRQLAHQSDPAKP